ncbi:MAG: hypothetical protein JO154_19705 [Chitinophaga sp.]|uniref:hypothetical protein n=1 Tax=Chitinophaga sp. TaxID=1869181 RepID=UPI0025B8CBED|nr:hypothetical protein [Chitinophaga sp.]MBV8254836.1 hypothetical protein [Chitinophaga sp.]
MGTSIKFKVLVVYTDKFGISRSIYPIIEAPNEVEARRIAAAQYPNASIRTVTKA